MAALNELIEKMLQKKKMQNLDLGSCCIICNRPKDDINELTCEHPQCINTVIECVKNHKEFSTITEEDKIVDPDDLKVHLEEVEKFYNFIAEETLENAQEKIELIFKMLNVKTLQEALDEIQSAIQKLETKNPD